MKQAGRIALGLAGGYALGRLGKARWLVMLGAGLASKRIASTLAQRGASSLAPSGELSSLAEHGRDAAVTLIGQRMEKLTERLHATTESLRGDGTKDTEDAEESAQEPSDRSDGPQAEAESTSKSESESESESESAEPARGEQPTQDRAPERQDGQDDDQGEGAEDKDTQDEGTQDDKPSPGSRRPASRRRAVESGASTGQRGPARGRRDTSTSGQSQE